MGSKVMIADAAYSDSDASWPMVGQVSQAMQGRTGLSDAEIVKPSREGSQTSVFSNNATNPCLFSIRAKLKELLKLPNGWDGYDGVPLDPDIASYAFQWLSATLDATCPEPQVVPLAYGGVQFEWHERDIDLEIEIEAPNKVYVTFEDHQTNEELDDQFSTDFGALESLLALLSDREP